jgi:membrane protease YdiL (CAAX protease family)
LEAPEESVVEPGQTVLFAVSVEGGLGLLALALGWLLGSNPVASLEWTWAALGWGLLATIPPLAAMLWCTHSSLPSCRRLTGIVRDHLLRFFAQCTPLDLAGISIAAGIGEELLFRGLLQALLASWLGIWAGLILASLLFGLLHFITPAYALFASLMGAYLGALWLWSDNLLAPLVTHAVYDFVTLLYLLSLRQPVKAEIDDAESPASAHASSAQERDESKLRG